MATNDRSRYRSYGDKPGNVVAPAAGAAPELLGELVQAVLSVGDAILYGVTKDGGAVRVILMSGTEKTSLYFTSSEALDAFCKQVAVDLRKHHS
jgi:hypothetical protein